MAPNRNFESIPSAELQNYVINKTHCGMWKWSGHIVDTKGCGSKVEILVVVQIEKLD